MIEKLKGRWFAGFKEKDKVRYRCALLHIMPLYLEHITLHPDKQFSEYQKRDFKIANEYLRNDITIPNLAKKYNLCTQSIRRILFITLIKKVWVFSQVVANLRVFPINPNLMEVDRSYMFDIAQEIIKQSQWIRRR